MYEDGGEEEETEVSTRTARIACESICLIFIVSNN